MPNWTPEQLTAIETTGCDLLVSASAGTGKTAVLVERIVRLVLDPDTPVDMDQLLVVTFTEAAAAEMREKIGAALRARLAETPDNPHTRRQALLIDKAQISTLHAFCHALLRTHFHRLGLDPEFSILDDHEGCLLRLDAMQGLFRDEFQQGAKPFLRWIDTFGGAHPESLAHERLLSLHHFMNSLDAPSGWAQRVLTSYPIDDEGRGIEQAIEDHWWFEEWRKSFESVLESLCWEFSHQHEIVSRDAPKAVAWLEQMTDILHTARSACAEGRWEAAVQGIRDAVLPRMPALAGKKATPEMLRVKDRLGSLRDIFKKDLQADLAAMTPQQAASAHAASSPDVHILLRLVKRFDSAYSKMKRARAVLDFNDLEQLCLRLLRDSDGAGAPSEVALLCQEQFEYVLVDEYQDINPVQEAILRLVSRSDTPGRPNNRFAVGDVKQSIYEFRQAAPEIFLRQYEAFGPIQSATPTTGGDKRNRVDLTRNFRSRAGILGAANFLFEKIMTREAGGMDYDAAARLEPGATFPPSGPDAEGPEPIEVLLLESKADGDEKPEGEEEKESSVLDWESLEREALLVGRRIQSMVGADGSGEASVQVFDPSHPDATQALPSAMRPVRYGDIVILLRSVSGAGETFVSILNRLGIPAYADLGKGLFGATEIRDVLNLLRLIDNPLQDIPLAAVLRSPFEAWTESDLALIRAALPGTPFHEAFREAARQADALPVGTRASEFLERLDTWRTRARRGPLADLVSALYDETSYPVHALAHADGNVRLANLRKFHELASEFDSFSQQGLGRFLQFVDELARAQSDYGAAAPSREAEDAVRIMTVHKSKGLEFPIVFLPTLGRQFGRGNAGEDMLVSRDLGLATRVIDLERGVRYPTPGWKAMQRAKAKSRIAEEMRIFYVAVTRARERLVLSGSVRNLPKRIDGWLQVPRDAEGRLEAAAALKARCPLDWVAPALASHPDAAPTLLQATGEGASSPPAPEALPLHSQSRFDVTIHDAQEISEWTLPSREAATATEPTPQGDQQKGTPTDHAASQALARIRWNYPHDALVHSPSRLSASEWKRRFETGNEAGERPAHVVRPAGHFSLPARSESDISKGLSAADRGTWTHLVLQHLDLLRPVDYAGLSAQVDHMIDRGLLTEERRDTLDLTAIASFFESELGHRVLALPVDKVWREVPFVIGLTPSEAGLDQLEQYDSGERVRVQGIIDCLLEEEHGLVLIDYKTDAITPGVMRKRTDAYLPQMQLYATAVAHIFPQPLRELWIHFLAIGHSEPVPLDRLGLEISPRVS